MSYFRNPPRAEIVGLLERSHTIAVVGLSDDPARPSHGVLRSMPAAGMTVVMDRCIYVDRSAMFER